jgi:hypothetical protein
MTSSSVPFVPAVVVVGSVVSVVLAGGCGSNAPPGALGEVGTYDPDAGGAFVPTMQPTPPISMPPSSRTT